LAHTIKYAAHDDGGLTLSIVADEDQTLTLNMAASMKHQLYELLKRSLSVSDWFGNKRQQAIAPQATTATL
jgi:hypothetical protein